MPGLYAAAGLNGIGLVLGLIGALADGSMIGEGPSVALRSPVQAVASLPEDLPVDLRADLPGDLPEIPASRVDALKLRRGTVEAVEAIAVLAPGVVQVPLLRGDAATALAAPGAIVLSRRLALKYFGGIDCVGRTLEIDGATVRVTAIAEDTLPATVGGFMVR